MVEIVSYGPGPEQFGELRLPTGHADKPLVVLIHGGFWRDQYRLDLMHELARALDTRGYGSWNVEYRRVGPTGGGYPRTLDDAAKAIDHLAGRDWSALAVVGHSAGGHLALWNASRPDAAITPDLTVSLAGVADVIIANRVRTGIDATFNFFGADYADAPEAYHAAQPDPTRFAGRVVAIHGDADESVPVSQSTDLSPHIARVEVLNGCDHFDVIDPDGAAWEIVFEELRALGERA